MSRKLQVRRGAKGDLPNLAEGEFGWCTDKKELYIGNADGNFELAGKTYVDNSVKDKANTASLSSATLAASSWSEGVYSFEGMFHNEEYNLEIAVNGDSITTEQLEAFNGAQIVGSATTNIVKALGTIPTIDIPIIITAVKK